MLPLVMEPELVMAGLAKAESLGRGQSAKLEGMAIVQLYEDMMERTQVALYPGLNYLA